MYTKKTIYSRTWLIKTGDGDTFIAKAVVQNGPPADHVYELKKFNGERISISESILRTLIVREATEQEIQLEQL